MFQLKVILHITFQVGIQVKLLQNIWIQIPIKVIDFYLSVNTVIYLLFIIFYLMFKLYIQCTNGVQIFFCILNIVHMALITYTFIPSSNKKNRGAKYPRFRINLQNGSKPFYKPLKTIQKSIIPTMGKAMVAYMKRMDIGFELLKIFIIT